MAFGFDPTYSAFLRSMGVDEQNVYAQARQQSQFAQNSFDRQLPVLQEQQRVAVEGVRNDAESRGVLAGGTAAQNMNYANINALRDQSIARGALIDQQAQYSLDAEAKVADLRRQRAEAELAARTRTTESQARSVYGA